MSAGGGEWWDVSEAGASKTIGELILKRERADEENVRLDDGLNCDIHTILGP